MEGQEADVGVGGGAAEEVAFCATVTTKLRKDYVGLENLRGITGEERNERSSCLAPKRSKLDSSHHRVN